MNRVVVAATTTVATSEVAVGCAPGVVTSTATETVCWFTVATIEAVPRLTGAETVEGKTVEPAFAVTAGMVRTSVMEAGVPVPPRLTATAGSDATTLTDTVVLLMDTDGTAAGSVTTARSVAGAP